MFGTRVLRVATGRDKENDEEANQDNSNEDSEENYIHAQRTWEFGRQS